MSSYSPPSPSPAAAIAILADPDNERLCEILTSPDPPVSPHDLAIELAAATAGRSPRDVSDEQYQQAAIKLHHHRLPKLADHGIIEYSRSSQLVSITPAGRSLCALSSLDETDIELLAETSQQLQQDVLTVLSDNVGTVPLETVVEQLSQESGDNEHPRRLDTAVSAEASASLPPPAHSVMTTRADIPITARIATTLHHHHLPALATAGLLAYDPDQRRIALPEDGRHRTAAKAVAQLRTHLSES